VVVESLKRTWSTYHHELFVEAPIRDLLVERHDILADENVTRVDSESHRFEFQVDAEVLDVSDRSGLRQLRTDFPTNLRRTSCVQPTLLL